MKKALCTIIFLAVVALLAPEALLYAQVETPGATSSPPIRIFNSLADIIDPLVPVARTRICGGLTQQGTPIAGDADGADDLAATGDEGTSGHMAIAGIPAGAKVRAARLYWTVLTADETSSVGQNILFNGNAITGTKMGTDDATPCFPQSDTIAWKADVTAFVPSPGNGTYTVSGFPGGNAIGGDHFTEGATLQVLWTDESAPLHTIVSYEAPAGAGNLPVTPSDGFTLSQALGWFIPATAPVSGRLYEVIGNGQVITLAAGNDESVSVTGGAGTISFGESLDGSTSTFAPRTCSYTDVGGLLECYWDDDNPSISAAIAVGDTSVTFNYTMENDCHDFPALAVSVRTDLGFDYCAACGERVDVACPPAGPVGGGTWKNHGEYVSCVAAAADACVANIGIDCSTSCIVNPRARSNVGKP